MFARLLRVLTYLVYYCWFGSFVTKEVITMPVWHCDHYFSNEGAGYFAFHWFVTRVLSKLHPSQKHAYIILTPVNPTFI